MSLSLIISLISPTLTVCTFQTQKGKTAILDINSGFWWISLEVKGLSMVRLITRIKKYLNSLTIVCRKPRLKTIFL